MVSIKADNSDSNTAKDETCPRSFSLKARAEIQLCIPAVNSVVRAQFNVWFKDKARNDSETVCFARETFGRSWPGRFDSIQADPWPGSGQD